jgi:hypothetical protein
MTDENTSEASASRLPTQVMDTAFLITASELRNRKSKRRRKHNLPGRSEAVRPLVELELKAKGK